MAFGFNPADRNQIRPTAFESIGPGRPRGKGAALPKPRRAAAEAWRLRRHTVAWYGGGTRRVVLVSRTGHWYKSGAGLVPIRWVFVRDRDGTHRDEFFFTTDPALDPVAVIETYTARWNLETAFQELRAWLGLETTRGWSRKTVLRVAPRLFGLYTAVALLYRALPEAKREGRVEWPGKSGVTFSDALMAVRRWLWREWVFTQAGADPVVQKLPEAVQDLSKLLVVLAANSGENGRVFVQGYGGIQPLERVRFDIGRFELQEKELVVGGPDMLLKPSLRFGRFLDRVLVSLAVRRVPSRPFVAGSLVRAVEADNSERDRVVTTVAELRHLRLHVISHTLYLFYHRFHQNLDFDPDLNRG